LLLSVSCSLYLFFHLSKQWRPPGKPSLTPINWISNVKPNYARHLICANSFHIHHCLCFIPLLDSVGCCMSVLPPLLQCCILHFTSPKLQYSVPVCWLFCHDHSVSSPSQYTANFCVRSWLSETVAELRMNWGVMTTVSDGEKMWLSKFKIICFEVDFITDGFFWSMLTVCK
jgi:hypothetical protein